MSDHYLFAHDEPPAETQEEQPDHYLFGVAEEHASPNLPLPSSAAPESRNAAPPESFEEHEAAGTDDPYLNAALDALGPIPCAHPDGPARCYCARGTTKPMAQVNQHGEVVATFCGGGAAKAHFGMGHEIYECIPSGIRPGQDLPNGQGRLMYVPNGVCANVGIFRVNGARPSRPKQPYQPKSPLTEAELEAQASSDAARRASMHGDLVDPGSKRKSKPVERLCVEELGGGDDYSHHKRRAAGHLSKLLPNSGGGIEGAGDGHGGGSVPRVRSSSSSSSAAVERPLNPFCTSGKVNCYCRSGKHHILHRYFYWLFVLCCQAS
jgi:hypothetical protein